MLNKVLDRTQLKYIAIIAMVIDHVAWGFVDFMTPLGQTMHIIGRFTLPIMCFFVAEGYRNTSNAKKYTHRMITFAIISILPFYIFFHEEYGYRQNIIFDLTLALIALRVMEKKTWSKSIRLAIVAVIIAVSIVVGGWIVMPILYVFIFYYCRTYKSKAIWFASVTVIMEVVLMVMITLNQRYHFSRYNWQIYDRLYLLGFVIALIPLYFYNGKKGRNIGGRYFFYIFYPAHFIVLSTIKYCIPGVSPQRIYIMLHVVALLIAMGCLLYACSIRTSRAQMATSIFMFCAVMYVFGFTLEITSHEVAGVYAATKLEYFAVCLVLISTTFCIQELSRRRVPRFVYAGEIVMSIAVMYCVFTYEKNSLFYKGISINTDAGPFPRMQVDGYGPMFYLFIVYAVIICIISFLMGLVAARESEYDKRRLRNLLYGMICTWIPYLIKVTNLTNGYEVPALGVSLAAFFVVRTLGKYSYLESVNFNNAINFGSEGVMVLDKRNVITYHNHWIHKLFGSFDDYMYASEVPGVMDAIYGEDKTIEKDGNIYELRVEPLIEGDEEKGRILWVFDLTEHYRYLNFVKERAVTDSLTGISNRDGFEKEVSQHLEKAMSGTFFMLDLDNFKQVNDGFGHDVGDEVLKALAKVIKNYQSKNLISGRIGGDEFCLFYKNELDYGELSALAETLSAAFDEEVGHIACGRITSMSVGIAIADQSKEDEPITYSKLYKWADRALYLAKEAGKQTYRFYK